MYGDPTHNYCGISQSLQIEKRRIYVKFDRNPNTNFEYDRSVDRLITTDVLTRTCEQECTTNIFYKLRVPPPKERVP